MRSRILCGWSLQAPPEILPDGSYCKYSYRTCSLRSTQSFSWSSSCVYICEESRVGSAPASSSVGKCECKRHLMTRTVCTNSHWSCPWLNFARASTGTWATVDTCKRRTGLGLDWNILPVAKTVIRMGYSSSQPDLSCIHPQVVITQLVCMRRLATWMRSTP